MFTVAVFIFLAGCTTDNTTTSTTSTTTTTTLEPGACMDAGDCGSYCMSSTSCEQYRYYHIETGCLGGVCKCTCISDELPPVISPEGKEFTYRDRVYVKTDEVMECSGSLTKAGNYTIWEESYNGYIYTAKEINIAENRYICYRWFEKPGVIIRFYNDEIKQDHLFEFDVINVDVKDRDIEPPFYKIEELVEGNWREVEMVSCPCGTECSRPPLTLEPGKRHAYKWNNRVEYCNQSTLVSASTPPGVYRVKVYLEDNEVIYSKKFEIKPDIALEITTDKKTYTSQELMEITVNIKSGGFLGNVSLHVSGISGKSKKMNIERNLDLDKGNQSFSFNYLIPYCSTKSCTSVEPGPYYVKAVLLYGDDVITSAGREVYIEPSVL